MFYHRLSTTHLVMQFMFVIGIHVLAYSAYVTYTLFNSILAISITRIASTVILTLYSRFPTFCAALDSARFCFAVKFTVYHQQKENEVEL